MTFIICLIRAQNLKLKLVEVDIIIMHLTWIKFNNNAPTYRLPKTLNAWTAVLESPHNVEETSCYWKSWSNDDNNGI